MASACRTEHVASRRSRQEAQRIPHRVRWHEFTLPEGQHGWQAVARLGATTSYNMRCISPLPSFGWCPRYVRDRIAVSRTQSEMLMLLKHIDDVARGPGR